MGNTTMHSLTTNKIVLGLLLVTVCYAIAPVETSVDTVVPESEAPVQEFVDDHSEVSAAVGSPLSTTFQANSNGFKVDVQFNMGKKLFSISGTNDKIKAAAHFYLEANKKTCHLGGSYGGDISLKVGKRSFAMLEGPSFDVTNSRLRLEQCKGVGEEELFQLEEAGLVQVGGRRRKKSSDSSSDSSSDTRRRRRKDSELLELE